MGTVKFDEGTKTETSLDLEDGEGIIFVKPPKNLIAHGIGFKTWNVTVVITTRRFVAIPQPPNKKNIPVESYYFKDMESIDEKEADSKSEASSWACFTITMKNGAKATYQEGGFFMVRMEMSVLNIFKSLLAEIKEGRARNAAITNASLSSFQRGHYTDESIDKYYAKMEQIAKDEAKNLDFSKAGHTEIRDYIVNIVSQFIEEVNK